MKLGLIGAGNMGQALLKGILNKSIVVPHNTYVYDPNTQQTSSLQKSFPIHVKESMQSVIEASDIIILAVKPNICENVLRQCAKSLEGKAILSIVTGWSRRDIEKIAPNCRVLRTMPNTPCLVGEGVVALDSDHSLNAEEYAFAKSLFLAVGMAEEVPSHLMDAIVGIAGSAPAYVFVFIEALADAGVREGLPRELAYRFASQTVLGAGKMVLDTKQHPAVLKDAVCSPGGTTIEAVIALERGGMRAAIMNAVEVCAEKARILAEK